MVRSNDFVVSLSDIDKEDVRYVGTKATNFGELSSIGVPISQGFVITTHALITFLKHNHLDLKIQHILTSLNQSDPNSVGQVSRHIQRMIGRGEFPKELSQAIFSLRKKMQKNFTGSFLNLTLGQEVRTHESSSSYIPHKNEATLLDEVRKKWGLYFSPTHLISKNTKEARTLIVQEVHPADASGNMYQGVGKDRNNVVIHALFGKEDFRYKGSITPDRYVADKKTGEIITKEVHEQKEMLAEKGMSDKITTVGLLKKSKQKLSDTDIRKLASYYEKIEKHFYFPQEVKWVQHSNRLYITLTKQIVIHDNNLHATKKDNLTYSLKGIPTSPGIAIGPVKTVRNESDVKDVREGDIVFLETQATDVTSAIKKASGIITEKGGMMSKAATYARELGIPTITGAKQANNTLKEGSVVRVDGTTGEVYKGAQGKNLIDNSQNLSSKTQVYIEITDPTLAKQISSTPSSGVGLLRAEGMFTKIGIHPKKAIAEGQSRKFINELASQMQMVTQAFFPRPVLYRACDFKTDEYQSLRGGKTLEPNEENPSLGYRGAFRALREQKSFMLELEAIKKVRQKYNNLEFILPLIRTVRELKEVKELVLKSGLRRSSTFKLHMPVEIPSNVILIDKFLKEDVDGVVIDTDDLTMGILGLDSNSDEITVEFDGRNQAVLWALEHVIKQASKNNIKSGVMGHIPYTYPEIVEDILKWGVSSLTVPPTSLDNTIHLVKKIEKRN